MKNLTSRESKFRRALRKVIASHQRGRVDPLAERAAAAARIAEVAENGRVAVTKSGMDCDCATYFHYTVVPANLPAVEREMQRTYDGADGPVSCGVTSPSNAREYSSDFRGRDLILEAFEDGHPHSVSFA